MANEEVVQKRLVVPHSMIQDDFTDIVISRYNQDIREIGEFYNIYRNGVSTTIPNDNNPAERKPGANFKKCRSLINKQARFMFANSPDFIVSVVPAGKAAEQIMLAKDQSSDYQVVIDGVMEDNNIGQKLLKAFRDCLIGKRVAYFLNFSENGGISISFSDAFHFYYSVDPTNDNKVKTIAQYTFAVEEGIQYIYKKKFYMKDGLCYLFEGKYDSGGTLVDTITPDKNLNIDFVPAGVILNDDLLDDINGRSDIESIQEMEQVFSQLFNRDIEAQYKSMNPIKYTTDADPQSTKNLSTSAGSYWDLKSSDISEDSKPVTAGILESNMSYKDVLSAALSRVNDIMYSQVDVPDVSPESLKGVVSSGKTLTAIYWGLIVRCDEKMKAWGPALINICKCIIKGGLAFPASIVPYTDKLLKEYKFNVVVENNYAIPEDDEAERTNDQTDVAEHRMSRKSYMKKWRSLTDDEIDEELKQIAYEKELLENSYGFTRDNSSNKNNLDGSQKEDKKIPDEEDEEDE